MTTVMLPLEKAIRNVLLGNAALVDRLGGERVYNRQAPPDTPFSYVLFQWQGGGEENVTPQESVNVLYTVKAVSTQVREALELADLVHEALQDADLVVSGWGTFWVRRESWVSYVDYDRTGRVFFHIGGVYRIRMEEV